jgi:peroxiredoxin
MVLTTSTMLPLGLSAPEFSLPDTHGKMVSRDDFKDAPAFLVVFMCNHCPYVKHIRKGLIDLTNDYQPKGVAVVAINSNYAQNYPEDGPEEMAKEAEKYEYPFPYLFDADQETARAYGASCTPDFFLFDASRRLVYRGQMDDSRPGNNLPVTGKDLRIALDAVLESRPIIENQYPSFGCNIKWKPGNDPATAEDYYNNY